MNIFWNHPSGNTPYIYTLYDQSFVPFCLYWWIRFSVPNEQDLKRLIPLAFFLVIFEVGVGFISWLRPEMLPRVWVGTTSGRTIGTLSFVHAYSLTIIFFTLLLFQAAMNQKSTITRVIMLVTVGIGITGVFLSFSRGVWLAGVAVWVGLLYLYRKHILRLTILLLIIISIFGSTVLYKEMVYAKERLNSEQTALVRFVIWDAGMQMIKLKPIWGWGYGDYKLYAGQFQRILFSTEATKQHASHNTFISFAAELGVPGLLLYLFPAVWCLGLSLKKWRYLPQTGFWSRKLLLIFWLFLLAYCIVIFFSDIRTSTYGLSLWWMVLGWIAVMVDPFHSLTGRATIHSPRI
jgi:O-antigen ligase